MMANGISCKINVVHSATILNDQHEIKIVVIKFFLHRLGGQQSIKFCYLKVFGCVFIFVFPYRNGFQ